MLKLLFIGADAVCPDYIFDQPEQYPNLTKLARRGASASYSAYVQKGYRDSYLSEMNWSSIYTGLAPWEHNIAAKGADGCRRTPSMEGFQNLAPFWQVFNAQGMTVGLWTAICCVDPVEIDGYVVSAHYETLETPDPVRRYIRTLQVCGKDQRILDLIHGEVPPRLYPRTLEQQGVSFVQMQKEPEFALSKIEEYHFQDALENFAQELEFFYQAMCRAQEEYPVDVLYFYTPTTDLIGHCAMYCDNSDVVVKAYQLLDQYVGKWLDALQPENVFFLSDHGMSNFKDLVQCSDERVRREAFAARDNVIWLPNGYIAFEARNGALLFTAHGLKGTFIAAGPDIRHTEVKDMRTLDIYPTLLEMMHAKIPEGRGGFVQDIFDRPIVNAEKLFHTDKTQCRSVAVLQCFSPSWTDIVLNELYIRERFARFTVIGEEKYRDIFLHNPRVSGFLPYSEFNPTKFDAVYCGIYNESAGLTGHIRVH
ncbi:MAG: hypothetical protein HFF74_13185 [Oscillospiraceae bacterium]|nr:hypothetical protein [Oscillospiraceae bacterium]